MHIQKTMHKSPSRNTLAASASRPETCFSFMRLVQEEGELVPSGRSGNEGKSETRSAGKRGRVAQQRLEKKG